LLVVACLKLSCKAIVTVVTRRTVLDCLNSVIVTICPYISVKPCSELSPIHVVLLNALQKELYTTGDSYFIHELADVVSKWLHVLEQCFSTAGLWHQLYRPLVL
jgi:hypothetical protein